MNEKKKITSIIGGDKIVLVVAIIAVFALFTSLNKNFMTTQNMINLLVASSLVGMVAIGHTYLIIAKQNDLSPGSLAAFCGVTCALLLNKGFPIPVAMVITLCAGAVVGLFNSWMVNQIKIEAFIATLVSQTIIRGFAYIICGGKPVAIKNQAFNKLGNLRILRLPIPVWVMIICVVIFGFILARTRFGRSVYAIGGSAAAANVNLEFDAITAVILGGTSFSGGVGSMFGTALGIILIQAFNTGLIMVNVDSFWQYVARGALLLFALTSDYVRETRRQKALLEASMKNA